MILVILGTQDKEFSRLLKAVDKEIEKGNIKDRVVVQAGQTKYESANMEVFDLLPAPEFDKLMDEADLVITHGGAGSILGAIKKGKKVIAAARLAKYKEHHNDHQKQIIKEFASQGYILELKDFNKLDVMLKKSKSFKPKKFTSNTNNMINLIDDYIEKDNHTSWLNKSGFIFKYFFFLALYTLLVFGVSKGLELLNVNNSVYGTLRYHYILFFMIIFFINKYFVYKMMDKSFIMNTFKFVVSFILCFILYITLRYEINYILFNILFFIITLLFNKLVLFNDKFLNINKK